MQENMRNNPYRRNTARGWGKGQKEWSIKEVAAYFAENKPGKNGQTPQQALETINNYEGKSRKVEQVIHKQFKAEDSMRRHQEQLNQRAILEKATMDAAMARKK